MRVAPPPEETAEAAVEERFETRDSIVDIWGKRTPYHGEGQWPVRVDERMLEVPERWVQSTCVLCSNDCGMDIGVKDNRVVAVRGRAIDRVNRGRLGPKGLHGSLTVSSPDRLTRPLIRRADGELHEASWDEAFDQIVRQTREIRSRHTSSAIGFYSTGQLFLEEYYTLAIIGKAGLGTPHMDGNTRLCTASASQALIESFGSDGSPGSYEDIDDCDTLFHVGHNPAEQQTVLWMRILDRRRGPNPPRLVVVDPRHTATAREADLWLAPYPGSNVPLLNGLLNLIIQNGQVDMEYVEAHTVGFDRLRETVAEWPPERVEAVAGVPAVTLRAAADILGSAERLVSTVLQGVYQSNQATAAACQVNNLHLIRGMLGKPGAGLLQMNGQPAGQSSHEAGGDGAFPGLRNWQNPAHLEELAALWNVDPQVIPARPPTHIMQMAEQIRQGQIKMLWVICTNPAVSLPNLPAIRRLLAKDDLFLVVQDAWLTETAQYASVVLPAAVWGEKTGTYTNADRTVHISHKAVDPPGEARPDLAILLEYARRMDFRDRDGAPLIKFGTPEEAFEAFKECTRGRPLDYTGLSYAKLTGGSGLQWPVDSQHPQGTARLYADGVFNTDPERCESYGHDLMTGAAISPGTYRAQVPPGRAIIKPAGYVPPPEVPDAEYPFWLTTGRIVYHWNTRTKTGRSPELNQSAPDTFVQISEQDALRLGIEDGEWLEVESRRGIVVGTALVGGIRPGVVFVPYHYGYWDYPGRPRAANEATLTAWDPVSKQPYFKFGAVRIRTLERQGLAGRVGQAARQAFAAARGDRE